MSVGLLNSICTGPSLLKWRPGMFRIAFFFVFSLLLSQTAISQQFERNRSWASPYIIPEMMIKLTVVYEGKIDNGQGQMMNHYSIAWEDTLGKKEGHPLYNRPLELHLSVYDQDSMIGRYTGLSTSFTHCVVLTNSNKIRLHFYPAHNPFYDPTTKLDKDLQPEKEMQIVIKSLYQITILQPYLGEFAPFEIRLNRSDRNIMDGFDHKEIILKSNEELVLLDYVNKHALDPDPLPHYGPSYCKLMALNRWQVDLESGKILRGSQWIIRKGIRKCCALNLAIIHPDRWYKTAEGDQIKGSELIKRRRLEMQLFNDLKQFRKLGNEWPY